MPNRPQHDPLDSWPLIKRDLVNEITELKGTMQAFVEISKIKEKTYSDLVNTIQSQLNQHHEVIYGDNKISEDLGMRGDVQELKKNKKMWDRRMSIVGAGAVTAIFTVVCDFLARVFKH